MLTKQFHWVGEFSVDKRLIRIYLSTAHVSRHFVETKENDSER